MPKVDSNGLFRVRDSFEFTPNPPFAAITQPGKGPEGVIWPHLRALTHAEVAPAIGVHPRYVREFIDSPLQRLPMKVGPIRLYPWSAIAEQAALTLGRSWQFGMSYESARTGFPAELTPRTHGLGDTPPVSCTPTGRGAFYDWNLGTASSQRFLSRVPDGEQPRSRYEGGSVYGDQFLGNILAGGVSLVAAELPEVRVEREAQSHKDFPWHPENALQKLISAAMGGVCDVWLMPGTDCLDRAHKRHKIISFDTYHQRIPLVDVDYDTLRRFYYFTAPSHWGYFARDPEASRIIPGTKPRTWTFDAGREFVDFSGTRILGIGGRAILNMLNLRNHHPAYTVPKAFTDSGFLQKGVNVFVSSLIEKREIDAIAINIAEFSTGKKHERDRWAEHREQEAMKWLPELIRLCYENAVDIMLLHPAMHPLERAREIAPSDWEELRDVPEDWSHEDD